MEGRRGAGRRSAAVPRCGGRERQGRVPPVDWKRPTDFRIYKTVDGGATWTMQFQNQDPAAFYDCFAFWTPKRGISHSDAVNGVFPDLRITDGTAWQDISSNLPPALAGEASFAASGTCVATQGGQNAWIATGGAATARILATRDGGDSWEVYDTPLVSSPSAGAFTVAFRNLGMALWAAVTWTRSNPIAQPRRHPP